MIGVSFRNCLRAGLAGAIALALCACGPKEPAVGGGAAVVRQLTESQYRNIIRDVFGSSITIVGRFDAPGRENGLLAVGASKADIAPATLERYDNLGRSIASQVLDVKRRANLVSCVPKSPSAADGTCAREFLSNVGRMLYRRPLTTAELDLEIQIADEAATARGDFYAGLEFALAGMLVTPQFLFVADATEPDPEHAGLLRLTGYSKASRLSFLLWNTTPDHELLTAAAQGDLDTKSGMDRQLDRMLASPALEAGVRNFFGDMYGFDAADQLAKDTIIYPSYSSTVATDLREQTMRTLVDILLTKDDDYRSIFTSRKTFMSRQLAMVNRISAPTDMSWVPYEFAEDDPRAGIQTQVSFLALHSHPGKSSPTLRGKAIREIFLCQAVPPPPGEVDFDNFDDASVAKTVRERLTVHSTNPTCAGCHKVMDPIGLTLESFDGMGQFRTSENGAPIDVSGDLDGKPFEGGVGLGKALHDSPAATSCIVNRLYAYATGHAPNRADSEYLDYLEKRFAADGYRFKSLLRTIAESEAFSTVAANTANPANKVAFDASGQKEHQP